MESVVYTVSDIQTLLGIGKNQAYQLVRQQEFPVKRCGKKLIIPKDGFDHWLMSQCTGEMRNDTRGVEGK